MCEVSQIRILLYGLEPTYEGLKLRRGDGSRMRFYRLEPTYEGLKPMPQRSTRTAAPSLEPTYEGLKLPPRSMFAIRHSNRLEPTYEGLKRVAPARWYMQRAGFGAYL